MSYTSFDAAQATLGSTATPAQAQTFLDRLTRLAIQTHRRIDEAFAETTRIHDGERPPMPDTPSLGGDLLIQQRGIGQLADDFEAIVGRLEELTHRLRMV